MREAGFLTKTRALARKDLTIELRSRDTLPPMLAFSLAVTLLLAFSLPAGAELAQPRSLPLGTVPLAEVLAGFLWVTVLFAGLVAFARTFEVERDEGAIDSLLLLPVDRSALFLAKGAANLVYIFSVQVFLVPAFVLLFRIDLGSGWPALLLVVLLADLGFVAVGTLFAALAARTTSRELMLPILALPMLVPVFIGAVELTSDLFLGGGFGAIAERGWFGILIGFDLIFAIAGVLTFEFALND
jgi:heme exporter protein B